MKTPRFAALFTPLFLAATSHGAWACATCWGDTSGSKSTHAAAVGIAAMVVLMFAMLGSIAAFGWHLVWRAKNPLPDYDELLAEDPNPGDSTPKS